MARFSRTIVSDLPPMPRVVYVIGAIAVVLISAVVIRITTKPLNP